jgi:hypothetical protein
MNGGLRSQAGFMLVYDWYLTLGSLLYFDCETSLFEVSSAVWISDQMDY